MSTTESFTTNRFDENKLSDRQRQVLNVVRAGKTAELDEVMTDLAARAQRSYADVTNDDSRTPEWRTEQSERVHRSMMDMLDAELAKIAGPLSDGHRSDFGAVFGTDGVPGDPASLAISRRDAGDRVASLQNSAEQLELLKRADLSGDEVLARAVAEQAYQAGNSEVLERFLETRPALHEKAKRLWSRRNNQDSASNHLWRFAMSLAALKPQQR